MLALSLVACGQLSNTAGGENTPTTGVRVEVGASTYGPSDTILVIIHNDLGAEIMATDHQTSCTIVQVQTQVNGAWQDQGGCSLGLATKRIPLAAGSSTQVQVPPSAGPGQAAARSWPIGAYRIVFTFEAGPTSSPGQSTTIYSMTFSVK